MKKYYFALVALAVLASACSLATSNVPVINMNPKDLLIGIDSLPAGGKYGPGVQKTYPNSLFDKDYVAKSGRVYGVEVSYNRGVNFQSPLVVTDEVVLYKDADGAKYSLDTYFPTLCQGQGYKIVDDYHIADGTLVCDQELNVSGVSKNFHWIYFIYKNVGHLVSGSGLQGEVTPGFIQSLAQSALQIVQKAPLSGNVTFAP